MKTRKAEWIKVTIECISCARQLSEGWRRWWWWWRWEMSVFSANTSNYPCCCWIQYITRSDLFPNSSNSRESTLTETRRGPNPSHIWDMWCCFVELNVMFWSESIEKLSNNNSMENYTWFNQNEEQETLKLRRLHTFLTKYLIENTWEARLILLPPFNRIETQRGSACECLLLPVLSPAQLVCDNRLFCSNQTFVILKLEKNVVGLAFILGMVRDWTPLRRVWWDEDESSMGPRPARN